MGERLGPFLKVVEQVEGEGGAFETVAHAESGRDGVASDPVADRLQEVGVAVPVAGALGVFAAERKGDREGAAEAATGVGHEGGEVFVLRDEGGGGVGLGVREVVAVDGRQPFDLALEDFCSAPGGLRFDGVC